ncbi:class I SAM-dependent methyltransferase [Dyella sp. 2RAB6]|uniref:class I SAM-dependent methyltransferase n=1 Tax=Dyella sp. 2RAB6 TaxID=3232992 RepID=UPI003F8EF933
MTHDAVHFLRRWFADPRYVGAIAPSGHALAELITRRIHARSGRIAEFGAGTGVFTRALLKRGVREGNLVLVERDEAFAARLRERFPRAHVLAMDAGGFSSWARAERFAAGAIVSGLPMRNLGLDSRLRILAGAFASLCGDGALYQFTYGLACPVPAVLLDDLQLEASRVGLVLRNLPPATVYCIRRRMRPAASFA